MDLERKAEEFARDAHDGQLRKDGVTPYITHPASVVQLLKATGVDDEDMLCAAWLHDVVEDCEVTLDEVRREFNSSIADLVGYLTKGDDRELYKEQIKKAPLEAQIIKVADVAHNCTQLFDALPEKTIRNKVKDCQDLYLDLAQAVSPPLYAIISTHIAPFATRYADDTK